jgi:hypothetical protein
LTRRIGAYTLALTAALQIAAPARVAGAAADAGALSVVTEDAPRTVTVNLVGGDDAVLRDSIRELLARLHVDVVDEPASDEQDQQDEQGETGALSGAASARPFLQLEIDRTRSDAALVVARTASGAIVARRFVPNDASAAILREELAHAVQAIVESAILEQGDRQAEPPEPPRLAPVQWVAPPRPPDADRTVVTAERALPRLGLDVATYAGAGPFANANYVVARMGAVLSATWAGRFRPALGASVEYVVPFEADGSVVVAHASPLSARLVPSAQVLKTQGIALETGLGGGIEAMTVGHLSKVLPTQYLNSSTTSYDPLLSAIVTLHVALSPSVNATLAAMSDFDFASRIYAVKRGDVDSTVLSLWRVRPALVAGFSFTALGRGLFASSEPLR